MASDRRQGEDLLADPWSSSSSSLSVAAASSSHTLPGLTRTSLSRRASGTNLAAAYVGTEDVLDSPSRSHPLRNVGSKASTPSVESTRPTLKRLTSGAGSPDTTSVWITRGGDVPGRRSLDEWNASRKGLKGKEKAWEIGSEATVQRESGKEVVVHPVAKTETLAGIALSYGITLSALRTANGMWPSDPLSLRPVLRIPLSLCNLPPAKRIEIESNSRATLWEDPSTSPSSPASPTTALRRPGGASWGAVAAAKANGTSLTLASRVSLEMSAGGGSSGRSSFDLLGSSDGSDGFGGRGRAQSRQNLTSRDAVASYLAGTNQGYDSADLVDSPAANGDEGGPSDILDLPTRPRTLTMSSSTSAGTSSAGGTSRRTLTIERVPEDELGFFSSAPAPASRPSALPSTSDPAISSSDWASASPRRNLLRSLDRKLSSILDTDANDPATSPAPTITPPVRTGSVDSASHAASIPPFGAQRAAQLRQRSANPSARGSPIGSPITMSRTSSSSGHPTPLLTGSPHLPTTGGQDTPEEPDSPGAKKKQTMPPRTPVRGFSLSSAIRHVSSTSGLGLTSGPPASASSATPQTASKWNTVRPGQPPPLTSGLRFLEEGAPSLSSLFSGASLSMATPTSSVPAATPVAGTARKANGYGGAVGGAPHRRAESTDKVELEHLAPASRSNALPVAGRNGAGGSKKYWGLWDDLEQEAREAGVP